MNLRSRTKSASTLPRTGGLLILTLTLAGCGREDIRVYRVAKDQSAPPPMLAAAGLPAGHPDPGESAQPRLTWKTPEGWTEAPPGQMRAASFKIQGDGKVADVSVIPLEGIGGGDTANVNRWRGQLGLEPASDEQLAKAAQAIEVAGQPAELHDVAGKNSSGVATRILGAIQHRGGTAWFFKMTGDDALVAKEKFAFVEFLKSLKFGAPASGAPPSLPPDVATGMPSLPSGHPDISASPALAGAPASEGKPNWQAPSGWKEIPAGQMLVAKYSVTVIGDAKAEVNIGTAMGGVPANVNRWRGQLGLGPQDEAALGKSVTSLDVEGGKAMVVDLSGTDARTAQPARILGAIVQRPDQTWFYKFMGDPGVIENQKEAFTKFVQAVRY